MQVAHQPALHGVSHHVEGALQSSFHLFSRAQSFRSFGAQGELAKRQPFALGGFDRFQQGVEHYATRSTTRTVFTARRALMRSTAAAAGGVSSS